MPFEGGNKSKGFCFIEYENPESAHQALTQMGGFQFAGRAIKVGPPKDSFFKGLLLAALLLD